MHKIELTPAVQELLTCPNVGHLPGPHERRTWLDEWEEAGWTKIVAEDGAIIYERPCNGSTERHIFGPNGDHQYSHPIAPEIVAWMPDLPEKRPRWGQRWRERWGWPGRRRS